jgi:hypothetical protein
MSCGSALPPPRGLFEGGATVVQSTNGPPRWYCNRWRVFFQWKPVVDGGLVLWSSLTRLLLIRSNGQYKIKQESRYRSTVIRQLVREKQPTSQSWPDDRSFSNTVKAESILSGRLLLRLTFPGRFMARCEKATRPIHHLFSRFRSGHVLPAAYETGPLLRWDLWARLAHTAFTLYRRSLPSTKRHDK